MNPRYCFRHRREELGSAERMVPAIVLIGIGALFLLNNLHIFDVHDVFRYWPAILIAIGIVKLIDANDSSGRAGGAVLLGVGGVFMARALGYLDVAVWDLWPLILIGVGLMMLLERASIFDVGMKIGLTSKGGRKESAVFSGGKRMIVDPNFIGAKFDAVFGGFEIDMRKAGMAEDEAELELNAVFGGIEVKVPESWSVVLKGAGVFGAFVDNTMQPDPRIFPNPKRLVVKGGAVFGGVELKN